MKIGLFGHGIAYCESINRIMVFNGYSGGHHLNCVFSMDTNAEEWQRSHHTLPPLSGFGFCSIRSDIVIMVGGCDGKQYLDNIRFIDLRAVMDRNKQLIYDSKLV